MFSIDDGEFEIYHPKYAINDVLIDMLCFEEQKETLYNYLNQLDDVTKRRISKYYFE